MASLFGYLFGSVKAKRFFISCMRKQRGAEKGMRAVDSLQAAKCLYSFPLRQLKPEVVSIKCARQIVELFL